MTRREFLGAAAAAVILGRCAPDRERRFVLLGDSCSGSPDSPYAAQLAKLGESLKSQSPEAVFFLGDSVQGENADYEVQRQQFEYWRGTEMAWVNAPLHVVPGNHDIYSVDSELVFESAMGPLNWVRRDGDVLFVGVDTASQRYRGGVGLAWLNDALGEHDDAKFKFVLGHYPILPVKDYTAPVWYPRPEWAEAFLGVIKSHGVTAYFCSHILTFDVTERDGITQVTTGGAGSVYTGPFTAHAPDPDYFHALHLTVGDGVQVEAIDDTGHVRETNRL